MKLELSNVSKSFGSHVALRDLSLEVDSVRVLVLIGPSGGGKSSLLRLMGGLDLPDRGRIVVNDHQVPDRESDLIAYRRKNGFLFQQFNLFPHMTALRNISLPLEQVQRMEPGEAADLAIGALKRFGLEDHADKLPAQLSGGQQQRVGIARAVVAKPSVLFLDEPTSALDPEMTAEVLELIEELAREGQDIILSTHEMGFARIVGDKVAFLSKGMIAECQDAEALFESPSTQECSRFLGRVMRY